jgi:hypothetical protein
MGRGARNYTWITNLFDAMSAFTDDYTGIVAMMIVSTWLNHEAGGGNETLL